MAAPLNLAATVTLDASQVPAGAQTTKQAIAGIGTEATASATKLQKLIDAQTGLSRPAANISKRTEEIQAYGAELDRLQAKFDPLFAAQQKYQNALRQIDQAQKLGAISATQAIDLKLKETNAYNALTSAASNAAAANKRFAEAAVAKVAIMPDRGADIAAYGQEMDRLRAKYNPLYAVTVQYKTAVSEIRDAHKAGAISADEMNAATSRLRQSTLASIEAIKGRQGGSDAAGQFRRQNLTYQLFDIGQTAFMGMNPAMILAQQGPQIAQIYAGQGGVNNALKDLGTIASGVTRLITPLSVSVGGLAAVVLVGASAWSGYLKSTKEVSTAASGLGRAVAGTSAQMEASVQAGAASAGISVKSARSMEAAFLRTGRIGSDNFEALISISKDFAATIGMDAASAGQALADLFADPEKAAQALYQQYGLIDAATAKQAINLAQQNRQSEAQAVLLKALPTQLASAAEATTAFGRAWENAARWISNAYDGLGKTIDKAASVQTLEEKIASGRAQRDKLTSSPLSAVWQVFNMSNPYGAQDAANLADLSKNEEKKRQQDAEEAEKKRTAEQIRLSVAATTAAEASPSNADALKRQSLTNSIAAMRQIDLSSPRISDTQRKMIVTAIDAQTQALDALNNRQSRMVELDRLDVQIQNERNPLIRANLEAQRTRLQLTAQETDADIVAQDAVRARNRVIMETIASSQLQASDMRLEAGIRAKLNDQVAAGTLTSEQAQTQLEKELQLRPLIAAADIAGAEDKKKLLETINQLRAGYDGLAAAQRDASAAAYLQSQTQNVDRLRYQTSIAGRSKPDQDALLARYDAEVKIRERGADPTSKRAEEIRQTAAAIAAWNSQLAKTAEAWNKVRSTSESAIDGIVDGLASGNIGDALESISKDLQKTILDLGVKNPLKNALTGSSYGTVADLATPDGFAKTLFGSAQSVGSMNVTAASVMINGGVGGSVAAGALQPANSNVAGIGQAMGYGGNYKSAGVDPRLTDILNITAQRTSGYKVDAISGFRAGDPRLHGEGKATDVQLTDLISGKKLGNYQDASSFGAYEKFAQTARAVQMEKYPELANDFRWGGYFGGGKGKYGALDTMHFDLGGNKTGMGGGSWDKGLTSAQASLWPGIQSSGTQATQALNRLATGTAAANQNLGVFGNGLGQMGNGLKNSFSGAGGSSGGFGWLSSLFGSNSITSSSFKTNTTLSSFLSTGFDGGGWTGYGGKKEPAGVVHKGEVVWSQDDVARAGGPATVDAMRLGYRGYDKGGVVGGSSAARASSNDNGNGGIVIHNYSGANVQAEQTTDDKGRRQTAFVISDMVGDGMAAKGGKAGKTLQQQYGVKRRGIAR